MPRGDELVVAVRIELSSLPLRDFGQWRDIEAGIQRGKEVLPPAAREDGNVWLTCDLRVTRDATGVKPRFLGPYAFGSPAERFLYLSWSGVRDGEREMFRRMKIPLAEITWDQVRNATAKPGGVLAAKVVGTARDGGPACATVPILGGWKLSTAEGT